MIQQQTILKVADNSGAKTVKCIKVLGGFKKRVAKLGNVIVVSVQELRNRSRKTSKVKKGTVHKALIIKTKSKQINKDGSSLFFQSNSVSLMNTQGKPLASRIISPVPKKLRKGKYSKFANISLGTL
ncbi:ribosomal protein L14 (mitochondrion) [Chaetoceros tenuissimus]|jgi:large subunit ribosomal protein L14|nr:ribosomal protein L14 [Chaetoceros tenuissimus]